MHAGTLVDQSGKDRDVYNRCGNPGLLSLALALGFFGLYALVRSEEGRRRRWFWVSGAFCGAAVFTKYGTVFLVPTALFYLWRKGTSPARILGYAAASLSGISAAGFSRVRACSLRRCKLSRSARARRASRAAISTRLAAVMLGVSAIAAIEREPCA